LLSNAALGRRFSFVRLGRKWGPVGIWQRYEEATIRQRRPADPTDPGDAADLSIMGYFGDRSEN
jgi:hypothetical protein